MTEPMTPAVSNLRGMPWMPLDVVRLLESDLYAIASGDEFKAAVSLWCKSWTQLPAASLPNDDRILAKLSGAGDQWHAVREVAMRGWVQCTDGRLYHPVVAEQAVNAWEERVAYRAKQEAANDRKRTEREERTKLFDRLKAVGRPASWNTNTHELRELVNAIDGDLSRVTGARQSQAGHESVPAKRETGRGTGTGRGTENQKQVLSGEEHYASQGDASAAAAPDIWSLLAENGVPVGVTSRIRHTSRIHTWMNQGVTSEQLRQAIDRAKQARAEAMDPSPLNPGFIDCHLQDVLTGGGERLNGKRGFEHGDELSRRFAAGE